MNSYNNYKKLNDIEKRLFKYSDEDLINILVENHDLIEEFYTSSAEEISEKMKNVNHEKIAELLTDNLMNSEIDDALKSIDECDVPSIVKENFPSNEVRELQYETISKIYNAIEKGYKYIVLEAVSGFGKSLIANTLSNIYSEGGSYILTTTNQLANQYAKNFKKYDIARLKPRYSFSCKKNGSTCSAYTCRYGKCEYYNYINSQNNTVRELSCEYLYQLKEGLKSDSAICTYDFFIQENFYHSNYFKPRKLLICDEGHNIDEKITNSTSLKIYPRRFSKDMKLNKSTEYMYLNQNEDYYYYLRKFRRLYEIQLEDKKEGSGLYIKLKKRLEDISKFMNYFKKNNENLTFKIGDSEEWIFKPVKVNRIINDALLKYADVCIFMSSSIFDHENFAFDIGIDESEIYSLRVPNTFDQSKNPINICTKFDMSKDPMETGAAEKSINDIKRILNIHKDEKGIIHTSNYDQVIYLREKLNNKRVITHNSNNRENVLNKFRESSAPMVLISPSMNEGVDLPGDLCRFQIIFKLPYLPFEDPWVKKRENLYEDGKEWYDYKMLTKLIQAHGRGIRFEGDYCKTYVLDNRLFDVINNDLEGNGIIPKYFIYAIENFNPN